MKKALITGITGQDGSYLAELLLYKGYEVHGLIRRSSTFNTKRIDHIFMDPHHDDVKLFLHYGDLSDSGTLSHIIHSIRPDEIYHLGAQSHVRVSFDIPEYTANTTGLATTRLLETVRNCNYKVKIYQASSSEMFGSSNPPQNENSNFLPRSPYACAKLYSYWMARNYREGYNLFISNGILFNHESPRRGETFVTRKITRGISQIVTNKEKKLFLGNLEAKRDWGFAPEYVEGMWRILQQASPDDFVLGTGETHSVEEFVQLAFDYVGLSAEKYVEIDPRYYRPTEVEVLIADSTKAQKTLNWKPRIKFTDLVKIMIDADFRDFGIEPPGEGDKILNQIFPQKWWNID